MPLLESHNLKKSYNQNIILRGINFSIDKGEFVSLLGSSGSGKSTFLHLLASIDSPDEGTISLNGKKYSELNNSQLSKLRNQDIGFVFQFHHLLSDFTLIENISLPGFIEGRSRSEVTSFAEELMDFMGIAHLRDRKPQEASGGEQQRAAVARALINRPLVVLADEPTGNLDNENTALIQELFIQINKVYNQSIIMATHDQQLAQIADRTLKIQNGLLEDV